MKILKPGLLFLCFISIFSFVQAQEPNQPSYWKPYLSNPANQAIYAKDFSHSGARSLELVNSVSGQSHWQGETINYVSPYPKTITFSGWAKGKNISSGSLAALDFYIVFEDNSSTWYYSDTNFSMGTYNWKNKSVTKTFLKAVKSITPYLVLYNGKGTIWFDDISVSDFQNVVLNPNAEQGTSQPDNWATYYSDLNNQTGWATDAFYSPRHSLKIVSASYKEAEWIGISALSQPYPKSIILGGMSKAQGVTLRSGGLYSLSFYLKFEDNSEQWYSPTALKFTTGTHNWQSKQANVTFPKGIKEIRPFLTLYNGKGTVWFDDIYALKKNPNSVLNPGMEDTADIIPPTGTITINNGAQYTNSVSVILALSAQDNSGDSGLSQMKFSNDNINWSTPENYATTKTWALTSGDGQKTVYVRFSDKAGNWSGSFSDPDGIILDTLPPQPPTISPVTSPTRISNQTIAGTRPADSAAVVVSCATAVVGTISYPTGTSWSCELTTFSAGINAISVTAKDAAGNESAPATAELEYIAPSVYWVLVDDYDTPLPGPRESGGWFFNCTGGDRGKLHEEDAVYSWDNNSAYTASIARISVPGGLWTYGGMWYSLIRVDNDNKPLNFKNIFGPYIKPEFQGKITEVAIKVNSINSQSQNSNLVLRIELKETDKTKPPVFVKEFTNLLSQAYPKVFSVNIDLPNVQDIEQVAWVLDKALPGDSISVDSLKLKAEVPTVPSAEQAFYWTYSWLMANYNPNTGMVKDKSRDGPTATGADSMESVTATAKAAKVTYYAYKKGYITYDNAVSIITKIASALINTVPRGPQGKNTLWPHFTENGGKDVIPPRPPRDGSEWPSGDTAYAALDAIAALQMIGDPQNQIGQLENFLKAINWQGLLLPDGFFSHGYKYDGTQISYGWSGFGMEAMGVNWAYASATGNITNMLPPPTDNGSGFIDNAQYPMVFYTSEDGKDGWGNDWDAYRLDAAQQQISWYSTTAHYNQYLSRANLFGLSAGEVPDVVVNPAIVKDYNPYGTGGRGAPDDGNGEVVTLHYSGMIADKRPTEAIRMWETLRDRNLDFLQNRIIISPLNNMESMRVDKNTGKLTVNHLKGSWNLSLQAEGWALADPAVRADLHAAVQNNAFLKKGYDILHQTHTFPHILRVPQDYPTIQAAINAAQSGDTIAVTPGQPSIDGKIIFNKAGVILDGGGNTIYSSSGGPVILCRDIDVAETIIKNCDIRIPMQVPYTALLCEGSVKKLKVENCGFYSGGGGLGIKLLDGAGAVIEKCGFNNCMILSADGNNQLEFIENESKPTIGPNYGGIYLSSGTALIKGNNLHSTWDGAIILNNTDATISNNYFDFCQGWNACAGVNGYNSRVTLWNNLFRACQIYSGVGQGVCLDTQMSTVSLYNNIFAAAAGPSAIKGIAIWTHDSNLSAKNNIFYKNAQGQATVYYEGTGTQDFSYNDFWANTTTADTAGIILGAGNIHAEPLFASTEYYLKDFMLGAGSLCINAGDPAAPYNDKDGTRNDMGIYGGPNSF